MRKQVVRGTTMLMLVMSLAFVTAVAANGQSRLSRSDVPFEFVANNQTLPAGHYDIADLTAGQVIKISNVKEAKALFATTIPVSRRGDTDKGKLVFHRYGNRYFLAEIWVAGEREGQKLRKSREEKAIENEMAMINSKTDQAARSYERVEIALVRQ